MSGRLDQLRAGLRFDGGDEVIAVGWLTAAIGVYSGYALFLMLWEQRQQGETVLEFLLALGAAASMSFAFEFLRSTIEGSTHHWSFVRVLSTIVMLAAFELFIIATDSAVSLGGSVAVAVAGFIFGDQFAGTVKPVWNLLALGALWLFVALTMIGKLRKFIQGWPYPNSTKEPGKPLRKYLADMGPDLARGAGAGVLAGAFWGPVLSIGFVFFFRAIVLAQWIHANYDTWLGSFLEGGSLHLSGWIFLVVYGPMLFAGWCAKYLGAIGVVAGILLATMVAYGVASDDNKGLAAIWPGATMLLVLGSPILATAATRHELMALAGLSAVIWGIPGLVLGLLAPLLRGPAHHPPVWGVVAAAAAVVMMAVTLARFQVADATRTEKGLLIAATAGLVLLALQLFQGRWSEEFWLFVALSVGLIVFGTTRAAQSVNLFYMQKNAYALITAPVATAPTPLSLAEELKIAPFFNFGQKFQSLPSETFFSMLPGGMDVATFVANPCAAVREFTAEQRAFFVASLQTQAAGDMKDANKALADINTSTQNFQNFQGGWDTAVTTAGDDPKPGTPEVQISEVRERLAAIEGLDDTRKKWADWAATPGPPASLLHLEEPATLCQSDLDNLLANMNSADQDRQTAETNLTALKRRLAAELPDEDALKAAEDKAAGVRDDLQVAQAQRLELAMTSSLGFWLTIGLLAMWRLTRPEPEEAE